ncbi:MAG: SH3 domain-containing protein [Chloroflexi bacterium]|nr:SH3 domain-containing protein [Chloroflexota bacterium]
MTVHKIGGSSTCLFLPAHIRVSNITPMTQCQQVGTEGIGRADVIAAGFRDGVDVWGQVLPNTQVCFAAAGGGTFLFLDAATAPRAVSSLAAFGLNGLTCTMINRAGTVALMPGPSAPAPTVAPPPSRSLSGCMVRTKNMLNFRAELGGEVIDILPYDVTLTALERTAGWFKVDYHGERGWISADYVEPQGNCG